MTTNAIRPGRATKSYKIGYTQGMQPWWQQPFFQVALPIVVAVVLATWYQSGRINDLRDTLGKRIDDMGKRLDDLRSDMNMRFAALERRLAKLEEKVEGLL